MKSQLNCYAFTIRFKADGAFLRRTEWGKNRQDAIKTLKSCYGDTFVVVE